MDRLDSRKIVMRPWNIAHRGGAGLAPENTLAAFRDAMARGADGAELDVQLSRDGQVVVHHDWRLMAHVARADGAWLAQPGPRIKDLTLTELRAFDIGRAEPGSDYARAHADVRWVDGEYAPTLDEVIAAVRNSANFHLLVELKCDGSEDSADPLALADAALAVVRAADFLSRVIFVGFDWRALARVKQAAPDARCWFTTDDLTKLGSPPLAPLLETIRNMGGEGWFPFFQDATGPNIAAARAEGLRLAAWTVNDPADMRRLESLDALCTDRPDLLAALP
jgi:glycerophosphoryl diester phosphodiesterase